MEFVALANHRKAIRAEIARFAERFRAAQIEAVARRARPPRHHRRPAAADGRALLMTGLAQVLALEAGLGVSAGHDEPLEFIERTIAQLEGDQ